MAVINTSFNIDNAIALYDSGKSIQEVANVLSVSAPFVFQRFKKAGIKMRGIRKNVPVSKIIADYESGVSMKQLAKRYGICRDVIYRRFAESGITPRNRSESMYLRMKQSTPEERSKLAANAHEVIRNKPPEFHQANAIKQAISKQRTRSKVGIFEDIVIDALKELNPIWQLAIGPYNIDIACGNIAIEIHNNWRNPHAYPFYTKRIKYLLECGWNVVYIKLGESVLIDKPTLNKIVSVCKSASLNPSGRCEYWMIRGTGEFIASGCMDGNDFTTIPIPESVFYNLWINAR
jgi:transposase-like protein